METHFLNHKDKPIKGFCITEIGYQNEYDFSVYHRHNYFEIFLFETGDSGLQHIDFIEYTIQKHHLYFVSPGQVHLLKRQPKEKGYLIQFTKDFLDVCMAPSNINCISLFQENNGLLLTEDEFTFVKCMIDQLKENYQKDSLYKSQKITKLFSYLIFSLLELLPDQTKQSQNDQLTQRFMRFVKQHIHQHRQVSYYANLLHVSTNKLGLVTKKRFGKSPLKIIHEELLIEIKRHLVFEHKSHKEIAFKFHFDDLSSYSRFIKGQTGMNPTELKNQLMEIVNS